MRTLSTRQVALSGLVGLCAILMLACGMCTLPFAAEQTYIQSLSKNISTLKTSLEKLQTLSSKPKLDDEAWVKDVREQLATVRTTVQEAQALTAPDMFKDLNTQYLGLIEPLGEAAKTYDQALDMKDDAQLQQAQQMLSKVNTAITGLRAQADEMMKSIPTDSSKK